MRLVLLKAQITDRLTPSLFFAFFAFFASFADKCSAALAGERG